MHLETIRTNFQHTRHACWDRFRTSATCNALGAQDNRRSVIGRHLPPRPLRYPTECICTQSEQTAQKREKHYLHTQHWTRLRKQREFLKRIARQCVPVHSKEARHLRKHDIVLECSRQELAWRCRWNGCGWIEWQVVGERDLKGKVVARIRGMRYVRSKTRAEESRDDIKTCRNLKTGPVTWKMFAHSRILLQFSLRGSAVHTASDKATTRILSCIILKGLQMAAFWFLFSYVPYIVARQAVDWQLTPYVFENRFVVVNICDSTQRPA